VSSLLDPHGRPVNAGPPALVVPERVAAERARQEQEFARNLREPRAWQKLLVDLQKRVREFFIGNFREEERAKVESRLFWQVHFITLDELVVKLTDDVRLDPGHPPTIYGWEVQPSMHTAPGAVSVCFRVFSAPTTPEFRAWLDNQQPKNGKPA
jgi:hypothetical protein